jgi:hypothetical protein
MLDEVRNLFAERGIAFGVAELHIEPMQILKRAGVLQKIDKGMIFDDLEEVAAAFKRPDGAI